MQGSSPYLLKALNGTIAFKRRPYLVSQQIYEQATPHFDLGNIQDT